MMTVAGVPILDWVLWVVLLGFGVEAYVTTRGGKREPLERSEKEPSSGSD